MAQTPGNDPAQAKNQGLPAGSRLDAEPANGGSCSAWNRKPSPPQQKVQSLGIHADPYRERKDRATK
jgi:hypothetical protein